MPKLTAIELEKFQTISSHTVIPIRNLTLMFGPNGAGKSSIFDALELMEVLFSEDWEKGNKKLIDYLDRWARKENSDTPGDEIGFGLQILFEENWTPDRLPLEKRSSLKDIAIDSIGSGRDFEGNFNERNFRFFIKFKKPKGSYKSWAIHTLIFESDQEKILEIETTKNLSRLDIYDVEWIGLNQLALIKDKLKSIKYEKGCYSTNIDSYLDVVNANFWLYSEMFSSIIEDEVAYSHLSRVGQQIIDFFKAFFNEYFFNSNHKNLPLVKASRVVPKRLELIALIEGDYYSEKDTDGKYITYRPEKYNESSTLKALEISLNKLEPHWGFLSRELAKNLSFEKTDDCELYWDELDPIKKINSMLREDLFIDNGYQLNGDILCLTGITEISDPDLLLNPIHYPKIVRLFLLDQKQRKVEIEDVGSGIGYILPVLASLSHDGPSLIQQPELHLHPALQSALGDAIIRSVENYKYFDQFCLIETHSEHLLLRILKLIKSSSKREEETISPLTFENLSLLYFEPKSDGSTKVKRLRVSPDGKLIDRWPGGFFNERYKDLFDDE